MSPQTFGKFNSFKRLVESKIISKSDRSLCLAASDQADKVTFLLKHSQICLRTLKLQILTEINILIISVIKIFELLSTTKLTIGVTPGSGGKMQFIPRSKSWKHSCSPGEGQVHAQSQVRMEILCMLTPILHGLKFVPSNLFHINIFCKHCKML